jgi:hypothetical protein
MRGAPLSHIERNYEYVGSGVTNIARAWRSILLYEKGIVWSCAGFAPKTSGLARKEGPALSQLPVPLAASLPVISNLDKKQNRLGAPHPLPRVGLAAPLASSRVATPGARWDTARPRQKGERRVRPPLPPSVAGLGLYSLRRGPLGKPHSDNPVYQNLALAKQLPLLTVALS